MPCWNRYEITESLEAADRDRLAAALRDAGITRVRATAQGFVFQAANGIGTMVDGTITVNEADRRLINTIKQAYARRTVQEMAAEFRWSVKGQDQSFQLVKGY